MVRGHFMKNASHWSSYVQWTIRNPKNVVDNFEKHQENIYGGLKSDLCDPA